MDEQTILVTRHGKTYRKRYAKPKEPNTKAQMAMRKNFTGAMRLWQRSLSEEDREAWRAFAQKQRRVDRVSLSLNRPPAHSIYLRFAVNALRAGFDPPRRPPTAPSPQTVIVAIERKSKGLLLRWDPEKYAVASKNLKAKSPSPAPVLEVRLAVTPAWVRPWQSLFRTLGFIPFTKSECAYSPVMPQKRYTFDCYLITPDGQQSRPFRTFFAP
jgi:hypothetical protein